ncbi:MAG: hypothetical protein EOL88_08875 [Bacteroidia bacterium]|nr:hypothetical protein [Bacteroidia bacterium]
MIEEEPKETIEKIFDLLDCAEESDNDDEGVSFRWNNIKWYDLYEEIDFIENAKKVLNDRRIGHCFIRVGEDMTDTDIVDISSNRDDPDEEYKPFYVTRDICEF